MREIKFRAWDNNIKEWIPEDQFYVYPNGVLNAWDNESMQRNDVVLMQFTGFHDKNGKEIYEGDIITSSYTHTKKEIVEIDTISHFDGDFSHIQGIGFVTEMDIENLEVIGNIYENPELLK